MKNILTSFWLNILSSIVGGTIATCLAAYPLGLSFLKALGVGILVVFIILTATYISVRRKPRIKQIQQDIPQIDSSKRLEAKTISSETVIQANSIERIQIGGVQDRTTSPENKNRQEQPNHELPYRILLGRRHRELRERVLKLNRRRMADFYGYEKVAQLEMYEQGEEEFPAESIRRLIDFFFIRRDYLEEGIPYIFFTTVHFS